MPHSESVIPIGVPIAPTEPDDINPTHIAEYGRGGCMSVADSTARDAIPSDRLTVGMLVFVQDEDTYYKLASLPGTWEAFPPESVLTSVSKEASADTILNASAWTAMTTTMSLAAGTWLIIGTTTVESVTNHTNIAVRIWNSTASRYIGSTSIHVEHSGEPHGVTVSGIAVLATTSTISFDANPTDSSSSLYQANGSGSKTCRIDAVRIS